jgi:hypothetical protein
MNRFIPACAFVAAFAVTTSAQDTTVKSKTTVDADDAKVVTMTGCLQAGATGDVFMLTGAKSTVGEDLEAKSKTEIDVDKDKTEVETRTRTEIEREDDTPVGTSGAVTSYELMPKEGVDLTPHVGHRVEITAVALDKKSATDDDAEVEMKTETKVEREDAPDSKIKSKTEAELPRGDKARLTVVAVKHIAPSCSM